MAKKKSRGPRGGVKHQAVRGQECRCAARRKKRFLQRAEKSGATRACVPSGPPSRILPVLRIPSGEWIELTYLYDKMLYWLYGRGDRCRAAEFRDRFEQLLDQVAPSHEAIFGEECWSILHELDGDYRRAIEHREREIGLIVKLREISKNTPSEAYVLRAYGIENLCDRLELLSILHHASGHLDRAIVVLAESRRLAESAGIPFEGEELLHEYLDECETLRSLIGGTPDRPRR
jgi:hypothetical protein